MPYTRTGLVAEARAAGFEASERLVTEWAQLGLLDQADRAIRTDGRRGALYLWPDNQWELFRVLLAKRPEVAHIRSLVQVPVGIWMYWGDQWVPVRQVRKALASSTKLFGPTRSYERAVTNARDVVREISGPGTARKATARLQEALATGMYSGHLDTEELRPLVAAVVGGEGKGGRWGPFRMDVDQIVTWARATLTAVSQVETVTDEKLYEARNNQRAAILDYAAKWRELARVPELAGKIEEPTVEMLINRSCRDLLFNLGFLLLAEEEGRTIPATSEVPWDRPPLHLIRMSPQDPEPVPPSAC